MSVAFGKIQAFLAFPPAAWSVLAQDGANNAPANPPAKDLTFIEQLLSSPFILPAGLFFIFYITFILPERRRKAEEKNLMSALKKNDRIVTVGGIHGTVVATANEAGIVTIRVDENSNTRIKINRTAIATVLGDPQEKSGTDDKESKVVTKAK